MSAYAALVTLSKAIHQLQPFQQHYSFLCDTQKMQSLLDTVYSLQEFFEHISGKSSDGIDELESRVRDVTHRLEDIVESILVHSLAMENENEVKSQLSIQEAASHLSIMSLGDVNQTTSHESTIPATSVESEMETSLDDILGWCLHQDLEEKAKYTHFQLTEHATAAFGNSIKEAGLLFEKAMEMKKILDNRVVISGTSIFSHNIATPIVSGGAPDTNNTTVGLKDDLNQILDQIKRRQRALEVIPITGMGGIGKTTLARAVYDHHGKQAHFDLVLWTTVSQQYNVEEILRSFLSVDAEKKEPNKALRDLVHQRLYGRRYLIILDDVWNEKVWDGVRNAFPNDNNCSRVILTTRLANVATYVSSSSNCAHQMQLLSEEQSWDLLRETVYGHEIGCPSKFEYHIGRRISRNCKGLPLALVVIGGLLKLNNAEDHWEHVATSTTAEAAAGDDSMLKILSLSYTNLPPHLKACFLYFGMFPEDEEIPTKELVRLWCAEGFLKQRESKTMEEVAEECLEELVGRNLVLIRKKRYNGKIKTSSIHDVLRELSLSQAGNEKFLYFHGSSSIDNGTFRSIINDQPRRVSFREFNIERSISYNSPIRTFRTDRQSPMIPLFKLVRVLGKVEFTPSAVRNSVRLNNLRYLHLQILENGGIEKMVPKSISELRNLETLFVSRSKLVISNTYELILPAEIWEMPRLRHLVSEKEVKMKLRPFPEEYSSTECWSLQTLSGVANFGDFTPRVIQKLQQNLKKLQIMYRGIFDFEEEEDDEEDDDDDEEEDEEDDEEDDDEDEEEDEEDDDDDDEDDEDDDDDEEEDEEDDDDDEEDDDEYEVKEEKKEQEVGLENLVNLHHLEHLTISCDYRRYSVTNIGFPINLKKLRLGRTCFPWEKMESIGDLIHLQVLKLDMSAFVGEVWEPIEGGFPQLKYLKMAYLWELEEWRAESTHFPSLENLVILRCENLKEVPAEIGDIDTLEKLIVQKCWDNDVGRGFEESVRRIEEESVRVGNDSLQVIIMSRDQELSDVDR